MEFIVNVFYFIDILLNFVKRSHEHRRLEEIAGNYLFKYFLFDVISTMPDLFNNESKQFYWLKIFRIVHLGRLCDPLELTMRYFLSKMTKKRQNDLIGFARLIVNVIYLAHILACIWIWLGW